MQCQASSEMLAGHLLEEQPQRPDQRLWHSEKDYRPTDRSANTKVVCVSVWRKSDLAMPNLGPLQQLWSKLIHIFWQLCKKDTIVRVNQRGGQLFLANWIQVGLMISSSMKFAGCKENCFLYSLYTSFWALAPSDIILPKSKLCPSGAHCTKGRRQEFKQPLRHCIHVDTKKKKVWYIISA